MFGVAPRPRLSINSWKCCQHLRAVQGTTSSHCRVLPPGERRWDIHTFAQTAQFLPYRFLVPVILNLVQFVPKSIRASTRWPSWWHSLRGLPSPLEKIWKVTGTNPYWRVIFSRNICRDLYALLYKHDLCVPFPNYAESFYDDLCMTVRRFPVTCRNTRDQKHNLVGCRGNQLLQWKLRVHV